LEQAKISGPASLRIINVALGPNDVEQLATEFVNSEGSKPFGRAKAIEEGFGPKTIELIVVAKGGAQASSTQLAELDEYLNGDQLSHPVKEKHIVSNQEATSVNYTPKTIDIVATVYGVVEAETIENALQAVIQPEALRPDGVTYEWEFGEDVPISRISHEIFSADEDITRVVLSSPAADVVLASRELPVLGTVTLTIVEP
jgi:phage-related baseplate assembly protein